LYAPGDPTFAQFAGLLDGQPPITVPSVTLDPEYSVVFPPTNGSSKAKYFTGPRVHHIVPDTGEKIPQQSPKAFVDAVVEVAGL
jgi:pimeloyl-ACP methyl ester carboxylesterase